MSNPSSSMHGRPLSSADLYAQVPTSDSTYPPIRTVTPRSPEVVNPPYASMSGAAHDRRESPNPNWLHERSPSTATFESQYSDSGLPVGAGAAFGGAGTAGSRLSQQPYRMQGGAATQSGTWDDAATGHSYSPEGSQANLMAMAAGGPGAGAGAYRGVPTGSRTDSYSKEAYASQDALGGGGAGGAGGLATLRKGANARGAAGGSWWARQSSRMRKLLIAGLVLVVLLIIAAVAIPVAITKSNDGDDASKASRKASNDGTEAGIPTESNPVTDWKTAAYGGNGSMVYLEDGSSFRYNNSLGASLASLRSSPSRRARDS